METANHDKKQGETETLYFSEHLNTLKMKKLIVTMMLLAFISTATAQGMANKLAESVATHLSLNASQKQTVVKLYKAAEKKQRENREKAIAARKSSGNANARSAREKAAKTKKTRPASKASGKKRKKAKSATATADRFLMIAYRKAMTNPTLKQELLKVFNKQQTAKWQQIGKR